LAAGLVRLTVTAQQPERRRLRLSRPDSVVSAVCDDQCQYCRSHGVMPLRFSSAGVACGGLPLRLPAAAASALRVASPPSLGARERPQCGVDLHSSWTWPQLVQRGSIWSTMSDVWDSRHPRLCRISCRGPVEQIQNRQFQSYPETDNRKRMLKSGWYQYGRVGLCQVPVGIGPEVQVCSLAKAAFLAQLSGGSLKCRGAIRGYAAMCHRILKAFSAAKCQRQMMPCSGCQCQAAIGCDPAATSP
jgi:hypothetical protein